MATLELLCDACAGTRTHEQPPCAEGHGGLCPDWICTGCNTAVFIAPVIMLVDRRTPVVVRRAA